MKKGRAVAALAASMIAVGVAGLLTSGSASAQSATTRIDFADGTTSPSQPGGTSVGNYYGNLGVSMPNLRFHDSTYLGNVPFNFTDGWGAVIDSGVSGPVAEISFASGVNFVQLDGMAQGAFGLAGATPYSWSISAFGQSGNLLGTASESFGYSFSGVPNSLNAGLYPLALISLRIDAQDGIYRLAITGDRKMGFDTLTYASIASPAPEPSTAALTVAGLLGVAVASRRRRRQEGP